MTKGIPVPQVTWQYRSLDSDEFTSIPNGVESDGETVRISNLRVENTGIYKCIATNVAGEDSKEVALNIKCEFFSIYFQNMHKI